MIKKQNKRTVGVVTVKKVAIYIRVSTMEQAIWGDSLRMQREMLTKWAKENDYIIFDYYIDDGYTGTSLKRPELRRMLNESENFDLIIFFRFDRFNRGVANYYKIMETLNKTNTHWKSITEELDTTTANGRLAINIMLSIAENESAVTSERILYTFKSKLENGEIISGSISLGYKKVEIEGKKTLQIDPEGAAKVKEMFEFYDQCASLTKTVKHLNAKGWKSDNKKLKGILTNKLYLGIYVAPSIGEFPDFCEPIIERDLFYRVQKKLDHNYKHYESEANKTYVFSGLMRCSVCGTRLSGNTKRRHTKKFGVRLEKTYRCQYHQRKRCTNKRHAYEPTIEKYLISNVRTFLKDYMVEYTVAEKAPIKDETEIQINKLTKRMGKLKDLYLEDLILKEEYEIEFNSIKTQLDELSSSVATKPKKKFNKEMYESFLSQDFEKIYWSLSEMERRRLWLSVIDYIGVDEEGNFSVHFI